MDQFIGMNFINGDFCPTRVDFSDDNPATGESLGMFPQSTPYEIAETVEAAHKAKRRWLAYSRVQRADLFDKLAQLVKRDHDHLVKLISLETGKNLNESHAEVIEALHMCQFVAGSGRMPCGELIASELPTKDAYVARKPKGVVLVISPWNFPLAIGSFWTSAPALLEGNTVIHKPSELTPMCAQHVAKLYDEAGFPFGVYNLLHGDGEVGKQLVESNVDAILFTGSAEVGQSIRKHCAETWNKTCSIECGSKSATILFEDGNQDLALEVMTASAFKLSGQRCVSSGRLLIQRSIFEHFAPRLVHRMKQVASYGDPFDNPAPMFGPLISPEQKARVEKYNQMVRDDKDAIVLLDQAENDKQGSFLGPFVYTVDEWTNKPYLKEEVFGPHVALIPFQDVDDAIRIYNDTDYGLALGESGNGWKSAAGTYRAVTEEISVTTNYEQGITWAQGMK